MKKGVLEKFTKFAKFTGKQLWFAKFSRTPFLQNSVWKTSDEYSLSRNTNLRSTVLSRQYKLSVYVFIGLHSLLPEAATRVEMFCKKKCS